MTSGPGLADRQQLLQWADAIAARSDLPRLIRRLILETGKGVVELGFPAGEGVSAGSWDGTARASEASAYVPDGLSLWEISTNKSPGSKADADYVKRTTAPDGSPTTDCTYIAVSLRPWTKRAEWAKERAAEGRWRSVRAYGVDDIETWLENAPVTHAWISEYLGLGPYGLRAGESWWQSWTQETNPPMSPALVLAGRDALSSYLREQFEAPPAITTLNGESIEEIQACVAALAVQTAEERGDSQILSRLAFVDDLATWRALQLQQGLPLILVPTDPAVIKEVTPGSPHHVVVPLIGGARADHEIPPIDANVAQEVLKEMPGVDDRADELSRLARRSLIALRRRLAVKPELHSPPWAEQPVSRIVRAVLLANRWSGVSEGDVGALSELSGLDGDNLQDALDQLVAEEDPLISIVEQHWALVSPYDAWLQLRGQLKKADLERFESVVKSVLIEVDPALDFAPEDRWKATFEGRTTTYTETLKQGLAETLALLGLNGNDVDGGNGTGLASYLVRTVLEAANQDETGHIWASLSRNLPLLAEAAPDSFLDAVRAGLAGADPLLVKMFADPKGVSAMFTAGSPHTGLLWALEAIAWSPDHFGQAIDLLARLEEIDPGGQLSNRPSNSLAAIFCPWHPENSATNAARLEAIDGLRERHGETSWRLMLSMLPELHAIHSPTHAPAFREWKPPQEGVLVAEYWDLITEVVERLVSDAGSSAARWADLVERASDLPPECWVLVRDGLIEAKAELGDESMEVWKFLRGFIAKHREYSDTEWALPSAEIDQLEAIVDELAPTAAADSHAWLFEEHTPDLGTAKLDDFDRYTEELETRRVAAVEAIQEEGGLDALLAIAQESPVPGVVGWALAGSKAGGASEDRVLKLLDSEDRIEVVFANSFFARRWKSEGWEWLEVSVETNKNLSPVTRARLLLSTADFPKAWEVAEQQGVEVQTAFWSEFSPTGLGTNFQYVPLAAEKMLEADRPFAALEILELYLRKDQADEARTAHLLVTCLERILGLEADDLPSTRPLSQHALERVFDFLEQQREAVGVQKVASLEWAYLQALGFEPRVRTLHEQLGRDPDFFVQIVSAVYKPHSASDEDVEPSDDARSMAANGYRLLSSWSQPPGLDADGVLDGDALKAWVLTVREKLAEVDRVGTGEIHVGHVLASSPFDPDGNWPCEAVRNLLEELQSERIEEGLQTQIFNNRGITSRAPDAGGDQERELAEKYAGWAEVFRDRWPRTAAVLRGVAASYTHQAKRHDVEAERRRRGLD